MRQSSLIYIADDIPNCLCLFQKMEKTIIIFQKKKLRRIVRMMITITSVITVTATILLTFVISARYISTASILYVLMTICFNHQNRNAGPQLYSKARYMSAACAGKRSSNFKVFTKITIFNVNEMFFFIIWDWVQSLVDGVERYTTIIGFLAIWNHFHFVSIS